MRREQWVGPGKWAVLALVPILAAAGCGGSRVTVSGKVSYKGTPLKGGNVVFNSLEGKESRSAPIAEDGTYRIEKCPVGKVKITVETESLKRVGTSGGARKNQPPPGANVPADYTPPDFDDKSKRYVPI